MLEPRKNPWTPKSIETLVHGRREFLHFPMFFEVKNPSYLHGILFTCKLFLFSHALSDEHIGWNAYFDSFWDKRES